MPGLFDIHPAHRLRFGLLAALALATVAQAADIRVQGDWAVSIGAADLAGGAGSDIRSPIDSATNQTSLEVSNTGGGAWVLRLRRSDFAWATGAELYARRTTDGSGAGSIAGGDGWVQITSIQRELCHGTGDRSNVRVQLRLSGVGVAHAPGSYGGQVIYSIH
jgi:hypothetical protein